MAAGNLFEWHCAVQGVGRDGMEFRAHAVVVAASIACAVTLLEAYGWLGENADSFKIKLHKRAGNDAPCVLNFEPQ